MASAKSETLAVPARLREAVGERDAGHCRVCGKYLGERGALHHIRYGGDYVGTGGRRHHALDNLVTICWLPGDGRCHDLVHMNKGLWLDLLVECTASPGVTALQLRRWRAVNGRLARDPWAGLRA